MTLLGQLGGLLQTYAAGAAPATEVPGHFDQVAQAAPPGVLAQGIAAALRSDETPAFGQLVSQLFTSGSTDQKVATLASLWSAAPPDLKARLAAEIPGLSAAGSMTPQVATALSPQNVQTIAHQVEQHDPSIVDKLSTVYATHPALVKTLGTAAMIIAMRKVAQLHGGSS